MDVIDLTASPALSASESEGGQLKLSRKRKRASRKNDPSNSERNCDTDLEPHTSGSSLFFVDLGPEPSTGPYKTPQYSTTENRGETQDSSALLLPAHVSVIGDSSVIQIPAPSKLDPSEEQYIEYLEYDGRDMPAVRYFDDPQKSQMGSAPTKLVCKNCGAENEHKTSQCPVIICYTCGARDEHSSRSCPISKTCFTCGMKGHINANCPNRYKRREVQYEDCGRCGSTLHQRNECPTLWRMYEYHTPEDRDSVIEYRKTAKGYQLGLGGERYISDLEWCYNCGESGHWGDDCYSRFKPDHPNEPSSFSLHNLRSGPFYDPEQEEVFSAKLKASRQRGSSRERELDSLPDDWFANSNLPNHVGSKGKKKARERLEKTAEKIQEAEEEEDWFARGGKRNGLNKNSSRQSNDQAKPPPTGPKFSFSIKGAALSAATTRKGHGPAPLDRFSETKLENRDNSHFSTGSASKLPGGQKERQYPPKSSRGTDPYPRSGEKHYHRRDRDSNRDRPPRGPRNSPRYGGGYRR